MKTKKQFMRILKRDRIGWISAAILIVIGGFLKPTIIAQKPFMVDSIYLNSALPAGILMMVWGVLTLLKGLRKKE